MKKRRFIVATRKVKASLSQEILNVMRPKERCSTPKLEERLRKKGVEFSALSLYGAVVRLMNEGEVKISTWCLIYKKKRNKDFVIKEITRTPGA